MERLLTIMRRLRDPETGCPWDVKQDFESIAPYTIEEAYEVADAIHRGDAEDLRDELGDLLLQVVFHAQMADEQGWFGFADVESAISDKMERRHPHVFGNADIATAEAQSVAWEVQKAEERRARGQHSLMDGVAAGLPEWMRAKKLQKRAAEAGFDWPDAMPVLDKLAEEADEVREAIEASDPDHIEEEVGDLLFAAVNLARQLRVDPGKALRGANAKFEQRFRAMEAEAGGAEALSRLDLDAQEALWQRAKHAVKCTEAAPLAPSDVSTEAAPNVPEERSDD
ncbi:MAG: nucleoside triphosphate pyrophosphohydrolase [Pseudomonadota bacterium]